MQIIELTLSVIKYRQEEHFKKFHYTYEPIKEGGSSRQTARPRSEESNISWMSQLRFAHLNQEALELYTGENSLV